MSVFVMALLGKKKVGQRAERIEYEGDKRKRRAAVHIVGNGMISHWAVVFVFDGGALRACELTAVNTNGRRWIKNDWIVHAPVSLDRFIAEKGYKKLDHEQIIVSTSPAELLGKCRANPLNDTWYDMTFNNCQRWIVKLLTEGYSVKCKLPDRWGQHALATILVASVPGSVFVAAYLGAGLLVVPAIFGITYLGSSERTRQ